MQSAQESSLTRNSRSRTTSSPIPCGFCGRACLPTFLLLSILEPVISFVLGSLAALGVLTAFFWRSVGPDRRSHPDRAAEHGVSAARQAVRRNPDSDLARLLGARGPRMAVKSLMLPILDFHRDEARSADLRPAAAADSGTPNRSSNGNTLR